MPKLVRFGNQFNSKSIHIAISLNFSLVLAGSFGALGRKFESCRPDSNNPSHRMVPQPFFFNTHIMNEMVAVKFRSKRLN